MDSLHSFGEWLRQQREGLGMTRSDLADCAGCSVSALRKIEADERRPSRQLAALLAGCLRIPPEEHPRFVDAARGARRLFRMSGSRAPHPPLTPRPAAASSYPSEPVSNLPAASTPFLGREAELAALAQLLDNPACRLLTIVGPGGIGKTRLAIEAAGNARDRFAEGMFFVSLAGTGSPEFLVPVIAQAVGLNFAGPTDPHSQLINYLSSRQALLLLDSLEHLLDGVRLLVELLEGAPDVKLLVTSRERLELQGEWVFEVQGLPVPLEGEVQELQKYSAFQLFLQRAQQARVDFDRSIEDDPDIVRICRLVEGMPLALELAAAWVPLLSCREIADEIERGLDILATRLRDVPERQRSLRAVLDHSWRLLDVEEQQALARLSIFRGGCTREAAKAVAGAGLPLLSALVAKSFLRRTSAGRFTMHELSRQFGLEHLREDDRLWATTNERFAAFYLALLQSAEGQLKGADQLQWLDRLEQEHDNLRAALTYAAARDGAAAGQEETVALQLAGALSSFWFMRGHLHEGRGWLLALLERHRGERTAHYARALTGTALLTNALGEHAAALALAEQSVAIYRELSDRQGLADALTIKGVALRWQGNVAPGNECLVEALALHRKVGDRWGVAQDLYELGKYLADFGGDDSGHAMLEESAVILEELGEDYVFAGVLVSLGVIALGRADYTFARTYFERSLTIAREIGYPWPAADALTNLGYVLRLQGDFASARAHFEEAIHLYQDGGSDVWDMDPLCALAETDITQGELAAARHRLARIRARPEMAANQWLQVLANYLQGMLAYYERDTERAVALLEETVTLAREGGYKPDLARTLVALGRAMRGTGAEEKAALLLQEGLHLFRELGHKLGMVTALEGWAEVAAADAAKAANLLATAHATRKAIGAPLPPVDCSGREELLAAIHAQLTEEAFAQAWTEGSATSLEQAAASVLAAA